MTTLTNALESRGLSQDSQDDVLAFEAERVALSALHRNFELWMTVAVKRAREIANRYHDRHAFERILEQQGLAPSLGRTWDTQKATASKLLKILAFRLAVEQWRATLSDHERLMWSAPTTVFKHCPVFAQEREETPPRRQAPRPEDAPLQADAERERAQRQADASPERYQELKEELDSARLQIEDLTRQLAEAIEERVLARDELARMWQNSAAPGATVRLLGSRVRAIENRPSSSAKGPGRVK